MYACKYGSHMKPIAQISLDLIEIAERAIACDVLFLKVEK